MNFLRRNIKIIRFLFCIIIIYIIGIFFNINVENLIIIAVLTNIIGWELIISIIRNPFTLKQKVANWYILFIHGILIYELVPRSFISFTMCLGIFLGRKLSKLWSIPYHLRYIWYVTFLSFLSFFISFLLFYGFFILSVKYPSSLGQYLIRFFKQNASESVLNLIGLKKLKQDYSNKIEFKKRVYRSKKTKFKIR
nr:hypothetical protein [Nitzschia traheaformis]